MKPEEGTRCPDCGYMVVTGLCCPKGRERRSGFGETLEAEKEGFEPSIPENGSGTGVHPSSGKDKP